MKKKILRILLRHYTKISYSEGIAKVIFDGEFEDIAKEIAESLSGNSDNQDYYERLSGVLHVTGELTQDDLEHCKLLSEQSEVKKELPTDEWISVKDRLPDGHSDLRPNEIQVIGFSEEWVHPDFNPLGQRLCCLDDLGWYSQRWNADHDEYIHVCPSEEDNPTHWKLSPSSPLQPETVEAKEQERKVCFCNIGCSKQYLGEDYYCRNESKN